MKDYFIQIVFAILVIIKLILIVAMNLCVANLFMGIGEIALFFHVLNIIMAAMDEKSVKACLFWQGFLLILGSLNLATGIYLLGK